MPMKAEDRRRWARERVISVALRPAEKADLVAEATRRGQPLSDLVREILRRPFYLA